MAILDDHDGCFLEVDAWNAQEEWEREAYPCNYPGSAVEDCAYWIEKARAAVEAAVPHIHRNALDGRSVERVRQVLARGAYQVSFGELPYEAQARAVVAMLEAADA